MSVEYFKEVRVWQEQQDITETELLNLQIHYGYFVVANVDMLDGALLKQINALSVDPVI